MSRTEALQHALAEVWSGAERIDAECVEDHLADLGFELVAISATRAASKRRHREAAPLASTRGMPKKAVS